MIRVVSAAAALLLACAGPRPAVRVPALAGKPLDVAAQDLTGGEVRLASEGRVLVVDFFASWCEPCRAQLPGLQRLAAEGGPRGLAVYGVSFDAERPALRAFLEELGVALPVLWDRDGARLGPALGIERLPTTLVVDRRGVIRHVHVGYDDRERGRVEREARALLGER